MDEDAVKMHTSDGCDGSPASGQESVWMSDLHLLVIFHPFLFLVPSPYFSALETVCSAVICALF